MFRFQSLMMGAGLALTFASCQQHRGVPPTPPPPVVSVTHPVAYPVQTYFYYNGNLDAVESVKITARVKGFLNKVQFTEGAEVAEGALLFKIDPREYTANVQVAEADRQKAMTEQNRARVEADRARELRASASISAEEYAQRVAAYETAKAIVAQAEAVLEARKLELSFTEITSPISGQIGRAQVTRGNLVGQTGDTLLTTVVAMDPLFIYFDAPERDLVEYQRSVRAGEQGEVTSRTLPVEIGVTTEDGYPHAGKIDFRENRVDPGTGTVRIRGRIPNPRVPPGNARLLYPGLYARVRVPSGAPRMLPAIPEDALLTGQEGRFVYVLGAENKVEKRNVTVGEYVSKVTREVAEGPQGWKRTRTSGEARSQSVTSMVAIEEGLTPDDRVIINGLTKARPGNPVNPEVWELKPPAQAPAK